MSKRLNTLVITVICMCVGCGVGYLAGAARSGVIMIEYTSDSNAGLLKQRINHLALIRTGHPDDSAAGIEKYLDNSIKQVGWPALDKGGVFYAKRLPDTHLNALQLAKAYADAGYRNTFSKDSLHILDQVEPIERKYCTESLRELQEQARK